MTCPAEHSFPDGSQNIHVALLNPAVTCPVPESPPLVHFHPWWLLHSNHFCHHSRTPARNFVSVCLYRRPHARTPEKCLPHCGFYNVQAQLSWERVSTSTNTCWLKKICVQARILQFRPNILSTRQIPGPLPTAQPVRPLQCFCTSSFNWQADLLQFCNFLCHSSLLQQQPTQQTAPHRPHSKSQPAQSRLGRMFQLLIKSLNTNSMITAKTTRDSGTPWGKPRFIRTLFDITVTKRAFMQLPFQGAVIKAIEDGLKLCFLIALKAPQWSSWSHAFFHIQLLHHNFSW